MLHVLVVVNVVYAGVADVDLLFDYYVASKCIEHTDPNTTKQQETTKLQTTQTGHNYWSL